MPAARIARRCAALLAASALLASRAHGTRAAAPGGDQVEIPAYDAAGALLRPEGYREWMFVGASLGLSYAGPAAASEDAHGDFHNVYLRPEAYRHYRRTGRFPDRTVLVLELFEAASKVAPSKHGLFEGRRVALEAAVKDTRLPDGWGYFSFGDGSEAKAAAAPRGACFSCHLEHAAVDNVFVQFYPVLRDRRP
jgi:hypothetical protein